MFARVSGGQFRESAEKECLSFDERAKRGHTYGLVVGGEHSHSPL